MADEGTVEKLCIKYLRTLDTWQDKVFNIRRMHHEVWNDMYAVRGIVQHRAGSRVERHTRILPPGGKSDVDYMFQVDGVVVGNKEQVKKCGDGLYFMDSLESAAYGEVKVMGDHEAVKQTVLMNNFHEIVFRDAWMASKADAIVLDPLKFKENVVSSCQFEMQKTPTDPTSPQLSPSIAGEGALNPYDAVPCLRLKTWPPVANDWFHRQGRLMSVQEKKSLVENSPVFLVPAGNPLSPSSPTEFRLSFSMLEIEIVSRFQPHHRQLYGFFKLLFKALLSEVELLSSYHLKVMMLWKTETLPPEFWVHAIQNPFQFVHNFMHDVLKAVDKQFVEHFFIKDCNIYPLHKHTCDKEMKYRDVISRIDEMITERTYHIIAYEMRVSETADGAQDFARVQHLLDELADQGVPPRYMCGYLTRLLSVCWYGLQWNEQFGQLEEATGKLRTVFEHYEHDENITRLVPMIENIIQHMREKHFHPSSHVNIQPSCEQADAMSFLAHVAFLSYLNKGTVNLQHVLATMRNLPCEKSAIGVTLTKFHLQYELDPPFCYIIDHMTSQWKSNRVYIHPLLMYLHLRIQTNMTSQRDNIIDISTCELLDKMSDAVEWMADDEPYFGKLSFKFTGIVLLQGYADLIHGRNKQLCAKRAEWKVLVPKIKTFISRDLATNFDLR